MVLKINRTMRPGVGSGGSMPKSLVAAGVVTLLAAVVFGARSLVQAIAPTVATIEQRVYVVRDGGSWAFNATTWDGVANSPTQGTDSQARNGIVRAQDTMTYGIEQSINEHDATNVVSAVTLPSGQRWASVPSQCKTADVTPLSSISQDGKTLICNTGNQRQGTKLEITAQAVVNAAKNGDMVRASLITRADGVSELPAALTPETRVTALYGIDVELSNVFTAVSLDKGPNNDEGQQQTATVTVRLRQGSELPAGNSQTLRLTFPQYNSPISPQLINWGGATPCVDVDGTIGSVDCSISGTVITVNLADINYAAAENPTSSLYRFSVKTWLPRSVAQAAPGSSLRYVMRANFVNIPASVSGLLSNGGGTETNASNNALYGNYLAAQTGGYCSSISADGYGSYGCGGSKSGSGTVTNGSVVVDQMTVGAVSNGLSLNDQYNSPSPLMGVNRVKCLKIDHRYFSYIRPATMREFGSASDTPDKPATFVYSENPSGVPRFLYSAPVKAASSLLPVPIIEYSTTPIGTTDAAIQAQKCDSSLQWQDYGANPPTDPSVMTALRIRYKPDYYLQGSADYRLFSSMAYKINNVITPTPAQGDKFPIYAHTASISADGSTYDAIQDVVYADDMNTANGYTDPNDTSYAFNNYNITRLNYITAQMVIDKETSPKGQTELRRNADGSLQPITYEITPSVGGAQAAIAGQTFTIQDELPTDPSHTSFAALVPGSATTIDPPGGHNGDYTGPNLQACTAPADTSKQCLVWTVSNVDGTKEMTKLRYELQPSMTLVTTQTFTNKVYITSSNPSISGLKRMTVGGTVVPYSDATLNLTLLGSGGYHVYKTPDLREYNVNTVDNAANYPTFTLHYENQSSQNFTNGAIIDILPYNGDTSAKRYNTFEPNLTEASRFSDGSAKQSPGLAAAPTVPAGATLQYVVYNQANSATHPANIRQDPCHVSNLAAGFDPLTDPSHYCHLVRWNGGANDGQLPGGGTTGTGTTPWSTGAPADFNDVVAFRVLFPSLPRGSARQTVTYTIRPTANRPNDYYCNNFSSRITQVSLEVRSNTVCARVNAPDITLDKTVDGNNDGHYAKSESIKYNAPYSYRLTVRNTGTLDLTGISVVDYIPAGVTVTGVDAPQGSLATISTDARPTVQWSLSGITLQKGQAVILTIRAVVKQSDKAAFEQGLTNGASINHAQVTAIDQSPFSASPNNMGATTGACSARENDESCASVEARGVLEGLAETGRAIAPYIVAAIGLVITAIVILRCRLH